jgi:hypothetical protein
MGVVKRTKDGIDILEHAMQGVHSSDNRGPMRRFHHEAGMAGVDAHSEVRGFADIPVEREVIVRLHDRRKAR